MSSTWPPGAEGIHQDLLLLQGLLLATGFLPVHQVLPVPQSPVVRTDHQAAKAGLCAGQ